MYKMNLPKLSCPFLAVPTPTCKGRDFLQVFQLSFITAQNTKENEFQICKCE